ncbi:hypothetical protein F5Y19DRAFT_474313 [Xylariaceae sp. FL1651]|nr:hypothetical protein F5Y19DRAFT_474313 [Xylariaceae sp. FL1651]
MSTSTSTFIATPTTSRSRSTTAHDVCQSLSQRPAMSLSPLPVTTLSTTSWRKVYPRVGQFAMTEEEKVVAAGPQGLFYFKRVRDHASRPWSEARPLPNTPAVLNSSSVSGLAINLRESRLDVYCVSNGVMHNFYRSEKDGPSFMMNPHPPLSTFLVSGTPAITLVKDEINHPKGWSLVVPCQSGGLLHTSTTGPSEHPRYGLEPEKWEPVAYVAKNLGVISAVSIATTHTKKRNEKGTDIVAVCIASARLYTIEGRFERESSYGSSLKWKAQAPTRICHPGEVTGNPVLVEQTKTSYTKENQLDLFVPSAEGGIFHFVRTTSTPDEWHMIARFAFPEGLPTVSCLAFHGRDDWQQSRQFWALVQNGGRLYHISTYEGAKPWSGSYLRPVVTPGPFSD